MLHTYHKRQYFLWYLHAFTGDNLHLFIYLLTNRHNTTMQTRMQGRQTQCKTFLNSYTTLSFCIRFCCLPSSSSHHYLSFFVYASTFTFNLKFFFICKFFLHLNTFFAHLFLPCGIPWHLPTLDEFQWRTSNLIRVV